MKLIGIKGRLHSGKDTAVSFIRDAAGAGANVHRFGYADKMKLSGVRGLGWDTDSTEEGVEIADHIKEHSWIQVVDRYGRVEKVISGRQFWQRYGTEAHRDVFGFDFWLDVLLPLPPHGFDTEHQLIQLFPGIDVVCITDCRFPNEAERVLNMGGEVWVIDADKRLGPLPEDSHVSEHPLPPEYVTLTIPNNTTLEQFEVSTKAAYNLSVGSVVC